MPTKIKSYRAFTLVEVMMVLTIFGFVLMGVLPFLIANLKAQFVGEQKLLINGDIRKVTNQMVENAREANSFVIYQSFTAQNRWDGASETRDNDGDGAITSHDRLDNGAAGDFMVLVYYSDPYFNPILYDGISTNNPPITNGTVTRLVGYWIAPNRKYPAENAIYRFDTDTYHTVAADPTWTTSWGAVFPATLSSTVTIESLLPPNTSAEAIAAEFPIMINNLSGLSNGYNFYNYQNKSIITRTKILHGNTAKRVTNTYNFTITPRG